MGSDSEMVGDDSPKKHRRSGDEEAEKTTKRRKHKHHRHRHSQHHHRSKKRDEEDRVDDLMDMEMEVGQLPNMVVELKKDYDDMEEGEIVEEDWEKEANHLCFSGVDIVNSPDSTDSLLGTVGRRDADARLLEKVPEIDRTHSGDGVKGTDVVLITDSSEETYKRSISPYLSRRDDELDSSKRSRSYHPIERPGSHSRSDVEDADTSKVTQLQESDANHKVNRKYVFDSDKEMSLQLDPSEHHHASRDIARYAEREPSDRRDKKYSKEISHRVLDTGDVARDCKHERERVSDRDATREKEQKKSGTKEQEKERSRRNNSDQDRRMEWDGCERVVHEREFEMSTEREKIHGRGREKEVNMSLHIENDKITSRTSERDRHKDPDFVDRYADRERDREMDRYRIKGRERERDRKRSPERSKDRDRDRDRRRERELSLDRTRDRRNEGNDSEGWSNDRSTERGEEKDRVRERRREGSYRERENGQDRSRNRYWDSEEDHLTRQHKNGSGSRKRDMKSEYNQ